MSRELLARSIEAGALATPIYTGDIDGPVGLEIPTELLLLQRCGMRGVYRVAICLLALMEGVAGQNHDEDWDRFRGHLGSGVSRASELPSELVPESTLLWRVPVPPGKSSPVLWNGRLFLSAWRGEERVVLCVDRSTGKLLWERSLVRRHTQTMNRLNDPAAPTPAVAGGHVFALFPDAGLVSFDSTGRRRWQAPLGPFASVHGIGTSPIVHGGSVILAIEQQSGDSFLIAFDAARGTVRWRKELRNVGQQGYGTPFVYDDGGQPQIVYSRPGEIGGWSLKSGEALWWVRGTGTQTYSSPAIDGDILHAAADGDTVEGAMQVWESFLQKANRTKERSLRVREDWSDDTMARADRTFGNNDGILDENEWRFLTRNNKPKSFTAVKLGGQGDVTKTHVLWQTSRGIPMVSSPVSLNGLLFYVRDGGIFTSLNARTGEVLKEGRLAGAGEKFYASPVAGDGKIYLASEQGKVIVIEAAADWRVLSMQDLGEEVYASPALSLDGRVYIRSAKSLYCFGKKDARPAESR